MITRNDFAKTHPDLREGMIAYSTDGEKLGKIVEINDDSLTIEKGFFFPRDFTFRYDDVVDTKGNEIIVNKRIEDLQPWKEEKYPGWSEYDRLNREEAASIPLKKEEVEAHKITRQTGEVRVRKVVHTEMKTFKVPVTKEEVIVERTPVSGGRTPEGADRAFKEEETRIPVMEEEIEVTKRPVVKEKVKVGKRTHTEEEEVGTEIRSEDVKVEDEGDTKRPHKTHA